MGNVASTRTNLKTILDGIAGLTVKLGLYIPTPAGGDTECFQLGTLPVCIIGPGMYDSVDNFLKTCQFHVKLSLYFGYTNQVAFDYTELEDLQGTILHEVCDADNFAAVGASMTFDVQPWEIKDELEAVPRVALSEMTLSFKGTV